MVWMKSVAMWQRMNTPHGAHICICVCVRVRGYLCTYAHVLACVRVCVIREIKYSFKSYLFNDVASCGASDHAI